ncbi:MAG: transposase [Lysobacter sp.]|nr:MAG: transposase [Lysobacter sp.]
MPNYRRLWVPGGTYFFTVNLADRRGRVLTANIDALRTAFRETRAVRPFALVAAVVMPNHLHCIWALPPGDVDNARRWAQLKSSFSRRVPHEDVVAPSRIERRERGIWQRRFWEHCIVDEDDLRTHADYIHYNPVKHGFVARPIDWPHSSFRRWVADGRYPADWAIPPSAQHNSPVRDIPQLARDIPA